MYRVLNDHSEVKERRNQRRHPTFERPELVADAPNQVWSWDITRIPGPVKGSSYFLYAMLDIFSRYIVGWMIVSSESSKHAQHFIRETVKKWGIKDRNLVIHSDRGSPMTAKGTSELLGLLGLTQSLSRPRTSNDNAFSESHFKTLKYHRYFKPWFESISDAQNTLQKFFDWYNKEHRHSGLGYLTPEGIHLGRVEEILSKRQEILTNAWQTNPERFPKGMPKPPVPPTSVCINVTAKVIQPDSDSQSRTG